MDADTLARKLAPRLVKARKRVGLTQASAARIAGIARTDLVAMEKGYRTPRLHQLANLGKTYGTKPGQLFSA
jgi:DNA-binding XRE family transcriptional regulator